MDCLKFETSLESLTPRQKEVLWRFLAHQDDDEIAKSLDCTSANVRRHITNICKIFGFTNGEGEFFSYRHDLVEAFIYHCPEKVDSDWEKQLMASSPEEPEFPGRSLGFDSRFYLERPPTETRTRSVQKPGALIRIRGPRKTGKTSLLNQILHSVREQQYKVSVLNLYQAGSPILSNVQRFLQWFCIQVSEAVELPANIEDYWSNQIGDESSCSRYLQAYILKQQMTPLVISIDDADCLFEYPQTAKSFFGLIRGWAEESRRLEVWAKLRQIIVYSTDAYIDFDLNKSPFNVGTPIKLAPFTIKQVKELAWRYGLKSFSEFDASLLLSLVGGQPHLVQLALYHIYENWTFSQVIESATSQTGIYANHLQALSDKLLEHLYLAEAFQKVISAEGQSIKLSQKVAKQLEGLGLVKRQDTSVQISCQLYQCYFKLHGIETLESE